MAIPDSIRSDHPIRASGAPNLLKFQYGGCVRTASDLGIALALGSRVGRVPHDPNHDANGEEGALSLVIRVVPTCL